MPIYEYSCSTCGKSEERIQGFSAPTRHDCSACGAPLGMERRLSRTAFILSGGGWYASGYGSQSPDSGASATGNPPPAAAEPASKGCGTGCGCHPSTGSSTPAAGNT